MSTENEQKAKLTIDEYFNYTTFPNLRFSPDGQYLLFQKHRPLWNFDSYESSLWLYELDQQHSKLLTDRLDTSFRPQWSPSGKYILLSLEKVFSYELFKTSRYRRSLFNDEPVDDQQLYLYSIEYEDLIPFSLDNMIFTAVAWSNNDSSVYIATMSFNVTIDDEEWKDVIEYRDNQSVDGSNIYRLDFNFENQTSFVQIHFIGHTSFLTSELLYVPKHEQLILVSVPFVSEDPKDSEIYAMNLNDTESISKLTNNYGYEANLQLSDDGEYVLYLLYPVSSIDGTSFATQQRLFSIDLKNSDIFHLAKDFEGNIVDYTIDSNSRIYILGQLGTNTLVYTQESLTNNSLMVHSGWNGTYASISLAYRNHTLAFVYSAFGKAKEIYLAKNITNLSSAQVITNDNELFSQRDLPEANIYRWTNKDDNQTIEGILHYPPGQLHSKNLPLLVLIHGGPASASLNEFDVKSYSWSPMAASAGWLVLEPNYRGSIGYGEHFLSQIRYQPVSLPAKDILDGIDSLIKDGIADPARLTVGGYSYGAFITNWLITQTTRFNAALSGAGAAEHVSLWGTTDFPILYNNLFGGFPWDVPSVYQNQSPIYYINKVRTPTLIVIGEDDENIPGDQSYVLERGLHYQNIPVKLLIFPNEGHTLNRNPWHGKIKVREELKWLEKYGHKSFIYRMK